MKIPVEAKTYDKKYQWGYLNNYFFIYLKTLFVPVYAVHYTRKCDLYNLDILK